VSDWPVPKRERRLRASAIEDLPAMLLFDQASQLLGNVVDKTSPDPIDGEPTAAQRQQQALWFMGVIAFRAGRAAASVLATGYEEQAVGYQRLIDEIHGRARRLMEDSSGEYAKKWLAGRSLEKGAKLAGRDFWEFMSGPVHANVRAVLDWLAISNADGTTNVVLGLQRRPKSANAAFTYMWPVRAATSRTCWQRPATSSSTSASLTTGSRVRTPSMCLARTVRRDDGLVRPRGPRPRVA
jgi:hypothetical protein